MREMTEIANRAVLSKITESRGDAHMENGNMAIISTFVRARAMYGGVRHACGDVAVRYVWWEVMENRRRDGSS